MVHFLQFVHLFYCSSSTKFLKPESGDSILALNHKFFMLPKVQQVRPKGPPLGFFRHSATFLENFRKSSKGTPCIFLKFSVCKKRLMGLNDLFLGFSALCNLNQNFLKKLFFSNASNSCFWLSETFFRKFFKCLQKVPLYFFLFFQRMDVQKLPNAPFYICRHHATYRGPKKFKNIFKKINFLFYFFLTWVLYKRIPDTFKSFCYF